MNTRGDNSSRRSLKMNEEFKKIEDSFSHKKRNFNNDNNLEEGVHLTFKNSNDK